MRTTKDSQRSLQLADEIHEFLFKEDFGTPEDEIVALARVLEARLESLPAEQRDEWFARIIDAFSVARQDCAAASLRTA